MNNKESNDLQATISQALQEMKKEAGDSFDLNKVNLAELQRKTGIVVEYIVGFLEEKNALGFSYQFEEYLLNVFDQYCNENGLEDPCFPGGFWGNG